MIKLEGIDPIEFTEIRRGTRFLRSRATPGIIAYAFIFNNVSSVPEIDPEVPLSEYEAEYAEAEKTQKDWPTNKTLNKWVKQILPLFLTVVPDDKRGEEFITSTTGNKINFFYDLPDNTHWKGGLFGLLDYLDQPLCKLAREKGYDSILLQREYGETRAVTEILDTRDRGTSYRRICKEPIAQRYHESRHPTIWYPNYGFNEYKYTPL